MAGPRRKSLFSFMTGGGSKNKLRKEQDDWKPLQQNASVESSNHDHEEDLFPDPVLSNGSGSNDDSYISPDEEDDDTDPIIHAKTRSSSRSRQSAHRSLHLKPTSATLGETFSSGGGHPHLHIGSSLEYYNSTDESADVQNSELCYEDMPPPIDDVNDYYYVNEHHKTHQSPGFSEYDHESRDDDKEEYYLEDADTLDYTTTGPSNNLIFNDHHDHDDGENESPSEANHIRIRNFSSHYAPDGCELGVEAQWEQEEDDGYDSCSKTLNTNLEGMNFVPDTSVANGENHDNVDQSYYYEEGEHDNQGHYQEDETFGAEGYCYDDEGHFMGQSYQDGEQQADGTLFVDANYQPYFDAYGNSYRDGNFYEANDHNYHHDENLTLGNSTIATEGFELPFLEPALTQPIVETLPSYPEEDETVPIESYGSEDSGSSWGEETRDMSLLDEDGGAEEDSGDDDDDSESESDDDSYNDSRRRRRKPKTMMGIINELKECALKGSSVSYDDEYDDDDDDEDSDGDLPSKAHTSNRRRSKGGRRKKQSGNLEKLFDKVSTLGQELLEGAEETLAPRRRKGKKSRRRKRDDAATRIVESLRGIFNCGHPHHY